MTAPSAGLFTDPGSRALISTQPVTNHGLSMSITRDLPFSSPQTMAKIPPGSCVHTAGTKRLTERLSMRQPKVDKLYITQCSQQLQRDEVI